MRRPSAGLESEKTTTEKNVRKIARSSTVAEKEELTEEEKKGGIDLITRQTPTRNVHHGQRARFQSYERLNTGQSAAQNHTLKPVRFTSLQVQFDQ